MIKHLVAGIRDAALETLYPQECRACGRVVESWKYGISCRACWEEIDRRNAELQICTKCGLPSQGAGATAGDNAFRCRICEDMAFCLARSCGPYEGALRESVLWLKRHPQISGRIREMLYSTFNDLSRSSSGFDAMIPVPLHPVRLKERSFNQSEVIAGALASLTGLRVDRTSLIRAIQTSMHRAGMGIRERSRSLDGVFEVRAPRMISGRNLLLVDDVITTGSTAACISAALLDSGASSVSVISIARAMIH